MTSSTVAELFAILCALRFITTVKKAQKWLILSDSQAALASLKSNEKRSLDSRLLYETLKEHTKASAMNHTIALQWIPGHCNIPGNTAADAAAGRAHSNAETIRLPISRNEIRLLLRKMSFELSKEGWFDEKSKRSDLFSIDPGIQLSIPTSLNDNRKFETLLHRLRLGTAFTRHFLYRIQRVSSPQCSCGHPDEDIHHLLLECTKHDSPRSVLRANLSLLDRRPFTLKKILGPWPTAVLQKRALYALKKFFEDTNILWKY